MAKQKEINKLQEAQRVLSEEIAKRSEACSKDIEQVLNKHGFTLQVSPSRIYLAPKQ